MSTRKVWWGGAWVEVGGAALAPSPLLVDRADVTTSSRPSVTATADATTAHTWGAWVEADASVSADCNGIALRNGEISAPSTNTATLVQVGLGAAGSETAWATVALGHARTNGVVIVPGRIPAGSRVAIRSQSVVVANAIPVDVQFLPDLSGSPLTAPTTYGVSTATSSSTSVTMSQNAKPAWTEITPATTADIAALCVRADLGQATSTSNVDVLVDIAIGASGAEAVLIPDLHFFVSTSENIAAFTPGTFAVDIPAGTRIAARASCSTTPPSLGISLIGAAAA